MRMGPSRLRPTPRKALKTVEICGILSNINGRSIVAAKINNPPVAFGPAVTDIQEETAA